MFHKPKAVNQSTTANKAAGLVQSKRLKEAGAREQQPRFKGQFKRVIWLGGVVSLTSVYLFSQAPAFGQTGILPGLVFDPPIPELKEPLPNGAKSPSFGFRVFGVDATDATRPPQILYEELPPRILYLSELAWKEHRRHLMVPGVDTTYFGDPVIFLKKRAKSKQDFGIALSGDGLPSASDKIESTLCQTSNARNWCKSGAYSLMFNMDHLDTFFAVGMMSHEMVHLYQTRTSRAGSYTQPHWLYEAEANGIGFGLMETIDKAFTRRAIGRRYATDPPGDAFGSVGLAFLLGLRHYDHPLAIDHIQNSAWRHPDYPSSGGGGRSVAVDNSSAKKFIDSIYKSDGDANWHLAMTGYMTGSLFRHALKGRTGGSRAIRALHSGRVPFPTDARDMRSQIRWLDDGLKLATVKGPNGEDAPIWRRGLRDVFPEMIVELADLPDLVIGRRHGRLSVNEWDKRLWSKPCISIDLSTTVAVSYSLTISPIAARCLRVKLPPESVNAGWIDLVPSIYSTRPVPAVPEPFVITLEDPTDSSTCKDLDVGTRGQMLAHGGERTLANGAGCAVSWTTYYAPLTNGGGTTPHEFQTVVITNVADEAEDTKERTILVHVMRPVVSAKVSGSATPKSDGDPKPRKPLPQPKRATQPGTASPFGVNPIEPTQPNPSCEAEAREIFECGDELEFALSLGDSAEISRAAINVIQDRASTLYLPASITRDTGPDGTSEDPDTLHHILEKLSDPVSRNFRQGLAQRNLGGGMSVKVNMQRLEPGQTGTFPAKVEVDWTDASGEEGVVDSLNEAEVETVNNCVVVNRRKTNAQVTIAQNSEGFLLGSLTANLFEPEADDEKACRQPIARVGTLQVSFSNPGLVYVDRQTLDLTRAQTRLQIDADMVAQVTIPLEERSDLNADDIALIRSNGGGQSGGQNGGATGASSSGAMQCPAMMMAGDDRQFAEAVWASLEASGAPGSQRDASINMIIGVAPTGLSDQMCAWVQAGRPDKWELNEVEP